MTVEFNDCEASLINNSNLNAKLVMDFTNNPKPITRVHVGVHIPPPQQFLLVFSRGGRLCLLGEEGKFPPPLTPWQIQHWLMIRIGYHTHTDCVNLLDMQLYTRKQPSLQQLTACSRPTNFLLWYANSSAAISNRMYRFRMYMLNSHSLADFSSEFLQHDAMHPRY